MVLAESIWDEAVVSRVHRRRKQTPIKSQGLPLVVVFVLVATSPGDLYQNIDRHNVVVVTLVLAPDGGGPRHGLGSGLPIGRYARRSS